MATLIIKAEGLDAVIDRFRAMPKQIERAKRRTVAKVAKSIASGAAKELAPAVGVAQKIIRRRISSKTYAFGERDTHGLVWFGLNPLGVTRRAFGTLRQTRAGAKAGQQAFAGAFVARMKSGHVAVFRRKNAARLPIRVEEVTLDTPATRAIVNAQARKARDQMAEVLARELNYEVNVRGR